MKSKKKSILDFNLLYIELLYYSNRPDAVHAQVGYSDRCANAAEKRDGEDQPYLLYFGLACRSQGVGCGKSPALFACELFRDGY